jgi:hypothetical protein
MRALKVLVAGWVAVLLFAAIAVVGATFSDGQVAICNPDAYGGITWEWARCQHELHLHHQWRHGQGTPGHTHAFYVDEAAKMRRLLRGHR